MEGITVLDMAQALGVSSVSVSKRLQRKGLKPFKYIGSAGIYKDDALLAIKDGGVRGRPKPDAKQPTAKKPKTKKITKKK